MSIKKETFTRTVFSKQHDELTTLVYDNGFFMALTELFEFEDGTHEYTINRYSLNEEDYWLDDNLMAAIKEFKSAVNKELGV